VRFAVEAAVSQGWDRYVGPGGSILGIDHYGASAPYKTIFQHFGFTVENVYARALLMLQTAGVKPTHRAAQPATAAAA
jgi:transketolase